MGVPKNVCVPSKQSQVKMSHDFDNEIMITKKKSSVLFAQMFNEYYKDASNLTSPISRV